MVRHAIGIVGNGHVSGNPFATRLLAPGGSSYSSLPTGQAAGTEGWVVIFHDTLNDAVGMPFVKDRVIVGQTSGARALVLSDVGGFMVAEIIAVNPFIVAGPGRGFILGETVVDNTAAMTGGTNKSSVIRRFKANLLESQTPRLDYFREQDIQTPNGTINFGQSNQWTDSLLDPLLSNTWPPDASANIYWDRQCQLASVVPLGAAAGITRWTRIQSSSGGKALVVAGETSTSLKVVDVQGTFNNGDTITNTGGLYVATLTISGTPANNDTVTIGGQTYTFKTTLTPAANEVLIGGSAANACTNLSRAINASFEAANTTYGAGTTVNAAVVPFLVTTSTVIVQNKAYETATAVSKAGTNLSWNVANTAAATGTQAGALTTFAAGNLVPYSAVPGLRGVAAGWLVPPRGDDVDTGQLQGGALGVTPFLARMGYTKWVNDFALWRYDGSSSGETQGGMAYGVLKPVGGTPDLTTLGFVAGETITKTSGGAAWSARVEKVLSDRLWVSFVSGVLATNDTISGAAGTAHFNAADNVYGWMKGAKHWQQALVTDRGAFQTALGSTPTWELVAAMGWEGDLALPTTAYSYTGPAGDTHIQTLVQLWKQWCADLRTLLAQPTLPIAWFANVADSQQVSFPTIASRLRIATNYLAAEDSRVRVFTADGLAASSLTVGQSGVPTTQTVFLQPLGYVELGRRIWAAYEQANVVVPSGNLTAAVVLPMIGQSQLVNVEATYLYFAQERNPLLARLSQNFFWPTAESLLDPRWMNWNFQTEQWEVLDYTANASGFASSGPGHIGPEVTLTQAMVQRYGEVWLFKCGLGTTSTDYQAPGQIGTWDYDGLAAAPLTGSVTVTPQAGGGVISAANGYFASIKVGEWVTIAGSVGLIGTGTGNNTLKFAPLRVLAKGGNDQSITVSAPTMFAETRALTIQVGPLLLKAEVERQWKKAVRQMQEVYGRIARVPLQVFYQGEGNLGDSSDKPDPLLTYPSRYAVKTAKVLDWMTALFAPGLKGEDVPITAICQLHTRTPLGSPAARAMLRSQIASLASRAKTAIVETGDLDLMPSGKVGAYPPDQDGDDPNVDFGVHITPSACFELGKRIDAAAEKFKVLPARNLAVL